MERPGEQQLGITNDLRARMRTHKKNGWTEIEVAGPYDGHQVEETERLLKQWLKSTYEIVEGTRENWYSKDFEAQSLLHLFEHAKSSPCGSIKNPKLPTAYKRH